VGFRGAVGYDSAHFSIIRIYIDTIKELMRVSLNFTADGSG
jgi:hypothetical protein